MCYLMLLYLMHTLVDLFILLNMIIETYVTVLNTAQHQYTIATQRFGGFCHILKTIKPQNLVLR